MTMNKDGLLPPAFSRIHPKFGTPSFATVITGLLAGIPILFIDMDTVVDLCSIGTLFAFILVCGGVLMLQKNDTIERKFKVPFINGKYIVPLMFIVSVSYLGVYQPDWIRNNVNPMANIDSTPMLIFFILFSVLSVLVYRHNFSLIPSLGIITCSYLVAQIDVKNWMGFIFWLLAGLLIYFLYSYKNSKLSTQLHK
jgi:basic amino acid/polyamine antiporter, APA family